MLGLRGSNIGGRRRGAGITARSWRGPRSAPAGYGNGEWSPLAAAPGIGRRRCHRRQPSACRSSCVPDVRRPQRWQMEMGPWVWERQTRLIRPPIARAIDRDHRAEPPAPWSGPLQQSGAVRPASMAGWRPGTRGCVPRAQRAERHRTGRRRQRRWPRAQPRPAPAAPSRCLVDPSSPNRAWLTLEVGTWLAHPDAPSHDGPPPRPTGHRGHLKGPTRTLPPDRPHGQQLTLHRGPERGGRDDRFSFHGHAPREGRPRPVVTREQAPWPIRPTAVPVVGPPQAAGSPGPPSAGDRNCCPPSSRRLLTGPSVGRRGQRRRAASAGSSAGRRRPHSPRST